MVIIQLAGGLGNQMFQYALYMQLKSVGKEVKIDDVSGFAQDRQRDPALMPFGVTYERPGQKEMRKMLDSSPHLCARVRRKLCGRKKKSYFEEDKRYRPEIMEWDDIYLEGYWQTEKYFRQVSGQVREVFDTDKLIRFVTEGRDACGSGGDANRSDKDADRSSRDANRSAEDTDGSSSDAAGNHGDADRSGKNAGSGTLSYWLEQIETTESVSVHIRRGDYLLPQNQELFGGICTEAYYRRAMDVMAGEHPGCVFYLFTNDKEWACEWAADAYPVRIVELEERPDGAGSSDYEEFALMSKCRHHIMANSSFSWWASYLNKNPHKTVLAPDRWLNGWDCEDIYRTDMRRISAM